MRAMSEAEEQQWRLLPMSRDARRWALTLDARLATKDARIRELEAAVRDTVKCATWSLAGDDPHDWRKGLDVIQAAMSAVLPQEVEKA